MEESQLDFIANATASVLELVAVLLKIEFM
jgi:hypothetical protein